MAHTYYGDDGLILTSITKENFDSGLSRVDCIYKCMTTSADALESTLGAGLRIPERTDYVIRDKARRVDGTDGFTTFTVSGFYGTLQTTTDGSASIPSVLGVARTNVTLTTITVASGVDYIEVTENYPIEIISDTVTKTFTINASASCLDLVAPIQDLNFNVQTNVAPIESTLMQGYTRYDPAPSTSSRFYRSLYARGTIAQRVSGTKVLINVNRSNFGIYDEISATWGLKLENFTITVPYAGT